MHIEPELQALIETGRFDELEERWLARVESDPDDVAFFVTALRALLDFGHEARASALVQLLLEEQSGRDSGAAELQFVQQALEIWPQAAALRAALLEAVRRAYADRPSLDRLIQMFKLAEAPDPRAALAQIESYLRFDVGRAVLMTGRGLGHVVDLNPALSSMRVEFPDGKRMTLKLAEAERLLEPLERGHFRLEKLANPAALQELAEADPGTLLDKAFASTKGPMSVSELRELLSGIVAEERWATWWKRASSDPRIASSGGKRPTYSWSASGEAADNALRGTFALAAPRDQLEMARKHTDRPALTAFMRAGIAKVARDAHRDDPSLALEALLTLERLGGTDPAETAPAVEELLAVEDPVPVVAAIQDRNARERAIALLRERGEDWTTFYARLLRAETDTRTLGFLYDALRREGGEESLDNTVDDVLARPQTAPRLFVWLCRELRRRPELDRRGDWGLLRRLLDAHTLEAFRGLRTQLRELFDDGGLGEHLASRLDRDQAEQLHAILTRELGIDEHRKNSMRRVLLHQHPELQETEEEVLYTTAEGLERKRAEFESITKVEIPHNAEEIRKAAAHGDLRENFEYKAAREKHEMLSSRAKTLHDELRRAKVLDPKTIDTSCVRVGTRVRLDAEGGNESKTLTILGPWDSDPANGFVSYLAPAIASLLGRHIGDTVSFLDGSWRVAAIEAWGTD